MMSMSRDDCRGSRVGCFREHAGGRPAATELLRRERGDYFFEARIAAQGYFLIWESKGKVVLAQLESFLQLHVPKPTFDRGKRFVVAVPRRAGRKRRILIEHVLHPNGNRGVIQPSAQSTGIILGRGDGHDVFLLAVLYLDVLTAILGKARHWGRGRRRQGECVRRD